MPEQTHRPLWDFRPFRPNARPTMRERLDADDVGAVHTLRLWDESKNAPSPHFREYFAPSDEQIATIQDFGRTSAPWDPDWHAVRSRLVAAGRSALEIEAMTALDVLAVIEAVRPKSHQVSSPRPVNSKPSKTKALKPLSSMEIAAWRMSELGDLKQEEIATKLRIQHGKDIRQPQVSRMIGRVRAYNKATGGTVSLLPPKPVSIVDPSQLDIGARRDHLAPRQRGRSSEEE